ncbi:MAG: hypothetical protein KAI97_09660 [Gemmatimonadetes bacterium]|nr:hypothetical protein [Gemmatimonadota bacterium]
MMASCRIPLVLLAGLMVASPLAAQDDLGAMLDARREAIPKEKRVFEETWLIPADGVESNAQPRFAGRVVVFQDRPKERLEIRRAGADQLEEPIVIVCDGRRYHLVTRVGATELISSEPVADPFVQLVLASPPGRSEPHRTVTDSEGTTTAIVLRHKRDPDFDEDDAFELKRPQVESSLLKKGLSSFSAAQDRHVAASAGARGVDEIETANGKVSVTPDPEAVRWMEEHSVPPLEFEEFRIEARLAPYNGLPEPQTVDPEA